MFLSTARCVACGNFVDKNLFPMYGVVCYYCEVLYNGLLATTRDSVMVMGKRKDVFASARGSGHFPLTFNFVRKKDGKYIQCSYCGNSFHYKEITRDHVYPKSKGGLIKTPACKPCNEKKEDMLPIDWAKFAAKNGWDLAIIPIGLFDDDLKEYAYNDLFLLLHSLKNIRIMEQENEEALVA